MNESFENIDENIKIKFGLVQQGHISTIEDILNYWESKYNLNMKFNIDVWKIIGEKIGWDPFTASLKYFEYLDKNK